MPTFIILLVGVSLVGLGVLIIFLGLRSFTVSEDTQRLNNFVTIQPAQLSTAQPETSIRRTDLSGSFRKRIFEPSIRQVGGLFGRLTPSNSIERLEHQLEIADHPFGLGPREFYGLRIVFIILGTWLVVFVLRQGTDLIYLISAGIVGYVGLMGPTIWLKRRVRKRQDQIRKGLPDALDMLSVTAEAGLDSTNRFSGSVNIGIIQLVWNLGGWWLRWRWVSRAGLHYAIWLIAWVYPSYPAS